MSEVLAVVLVSAVSGSMLGSALAVLLVHRVLPTLLPENLHRRWSCVRTYCWATVLAWLVWTFVVQRVIR